MRKHQAPAVALLLLLAACATLSARQKVLLPAMRLAWTGVSDNIVSGIEEGAATGRLTIERVADLRLSRDALDSSLTSGDATAMASVDWRALAVEASLGIDARVVRGEISNGVALSLKERLMKFDESIKTYLEKN